jgi:hypothetical protein
VIREVERAGTWPPDKAALRDGAGKTRRPLGALGSESDAAEDGAEDAPDPRAAPGRKLEPECRR